MFGPKLPLEGLHCQFRTFPSPPRNRAGRGHRRSQGIGAPPSPTHKIKQKSSMVHSCGLCEQAIWNLPSSTLPHPPGPPAERFVKGEGRLPPIRGFHNVMRSMRGLTRNICLLLDLAVFFAVAILTGRAGAFADNSVEPRGNLPQLQFWC
jgi:hypothetical protein